MLIFVQRPRQLKIMLLRLRIDRLRRQQRHLTAVEQLQNPSNPPKPDGMHKNQCGSGLAREGVVSVDI